MASGDHRCDVSPFCGRIPPPLVRLGLSADPPWRWVHLGPIATDGAQLVEHFDGSHALARAVPVTRGLRRFSGYHLDLLGQVSPPAGWSANYHQMAGLWYVFAVAWRDTDGPRVEWRAERAGPGELLTRHRAGLAVPDAAAIIGRCHDLLQGRLVARGRPPKTAGELAADADLVMQVDQIKARRPHRNREAIARDIGVNPRTDRRIRAEARRLGLIDDQTRRLA